MHDQQPTFQLPLAQPPWTQLGKHLESMCRKALFDFNMLEGIDHLALALSGGKDSLTLLYLLKAILGKGCPDLKLTAIHVKGEFSCGASLSEVFVKNICAKLDVPLIVCESMQKQDLNCYRCSRTRRSLIFKAAKNQSIASVAFAHHRDDMIQTLLLNLLHKGEFATSLPKIFLHDYDVTIIRPLIYIPEEKIIEFAKLYRFIRQTCQCPKGQTSKRAEVKMLLNKMETLFPHVKGNLTHAAFQYGSQKARNK